MNNDGITIERIFDAPRAKVWEAWTTPELIKQWWGPEGFSAPSIKVDLRVGGKFLTTMSAKDKSASFDFEGMYSAVEENKLIEYDMSDGRHVKTAFETTPQGILITQTFDPENENTLEMQKEGWQAILNSFKEYSERR